MLPGAGMKKGRLSYMVRDSLPCRHAGGIRRRYFRYSSTVTG
jgi:hypothetical protein